MMNNIGIKLNHVIVHIGFPKEELIRRKSQIILTPGYIILAVVHSGNAFAKIVRHLYISRET